MSKTAELKFAGTRFVMNSVAWDTYAKMAQVVCTVLASMEGYSTSAQDAATKACDSLLMQRAVVLLIADDPQYAKNCAKAELARILADVILARWLTPPNSAKAWLNCSAIPSTKSTWQCLNSTIRLSGFSACGW